MGAMTASTEPAGLPPGPLTVADLEGMPDDGHRYELLDGEGEYRLVAKSTAEEPFAVAHPFPFRVRPVDLLRPGRPKTEAPPPTG